MAMAEPARPAPAAPGQAGQPGGAAYAAVDLIRAKRDGVALTGDEIRWLIGAYLSGEVAEEQMSAMLMAVYFRGLDAPELRSWTSAMVDSGERLDLGSLSPPWTSIRPGAWATRSR
jgi:anthranilate phosphoribosyltransferase